MKLSAVQCAALRSIIDRYDRAVRDERSRWGEESASFVAAKGIEVGSDIDYRTLHALVDRGLVRMQTATGTGETLRRGAFGRWIGGTRKTSHVILFAAPTDLGREVV